MDPSPIQFIDLQHGNVLALLAIGFVGGLVSGFIGSGGAFVLTPAMMSMGVPGGAEASWASALSAYLVFIVSIGTRRVA